jgi:hypothetical protein
VRLGVVSSKQAFAHLTFSNVTKTPTWFHLKIALQRQYHRNHRKRSGAAMPGTVCILMMHKYKEKTSSRLKIKEKIFKLAPHGRGALNVPLKRCSTQIVLGYISNDQKTHKSLPFFKSTGGNHSIIQKTEPDFK